MNECSTHCAARRNPRCGLLRSRTTVNAGFDDLNVTSAFCPKSLSITDTAIECAYVSSWCHLSSALSNVPMDTGAEGNRERT